ncbi:MAG: SDR family oxidoreductase [Gemmatimonadales bacterium]|nr:SDR family oxidoreductase [Gemmatimonadales bacterium]NIN12579.1 SDR family oxidoreductase [Gemmatimonadales bacterium]NIR03574.1 SDR family oxidoreductase [Gemmatimonadales bacterium]NIS65896.1 SDR family oxidoreductase [Gemmatimonadales bacterium]
MPADRFSRKVVVITGASSGIGEALALRLASEGAWLALAARRAERLDALAAVCKERGGRALPLPADVADEAACRDLVARTVSEYGRLDMLVNNAGITVASLFSELPDLTLFRRVIDVNFLGAVSCTYNALPHLKQVAGRLVNVASLGAVLPIPANTSYIASKHAMLGFSDSLRMELSGSGVSVTVICPYWVVTEFHENMMDGQGRPRGVAGRRIYTRRTMTADQCARILVEAARKRKRQVVMAPGRLAQLGRLVAPALIDRVIIKAFFRPAVRRAQAQKQ